MMPCVDGAQLLRSRFTIEDYLFNQRREAFVEAHPDAEALLASDDLFQVISVKDGTGEGVSNAILSLSAVFRNMESINAYYVKCDGYLLIVKWDLVQRRVCIAENEIPGLEQRFGIKDLVVAPDDLC